MNKNKLPMLWPYSIDDPTTWKYSDVIITSEKSKGRSQVVRWIRNPEFKYTHFDKEINHANITVHS
jgi:hypothetical protein